MTDAELRSLVRQVIARELGGAAGGRAGTDPAAGRSHGVTAAGVACGVGHASHARFTVTRADDRDDCLIEPDVRCNHCGFCQSFGH